MRQRQRSPILGILQLAIFVFWQVSRGFSSDPGGAPSAAFDSTFRTMRLVFLGVVASIALNLLYPLAAWGVGKLRAAGDVGAGRALRRPGGRVAPAGSGLPNCGASLFDDAPTCPWCGHTLV